MMEEKLINKMPSEAFLVRDGSLKDIDAPFYEWLKENGYEHAWHKGHYGCDWVYVNITQKMFAFGMPGIEIVKAIGNHAITLDEFYTINAIYEKYEGLDPMSFTKEEQKERNTVRYHVDVRDKESRMELIERLERDGFVIEDDGLSFKESIIESRFPLIINITDRMYTMHHQTMTAACAASVMISLDEFWALYKKSDCTYEEYYRAVKNIFVRKNEHYTEEVTDSYFEEERETLKDEYEA